MNQELPSLVALPLDDVPYGTTSLLGNTRKQRLVKQENMICGVEGAS
jgi:hypothetical protein